jgi:phage terminase small subunit
MPKAPPELTQRERYFAQLVVKKGPMWSLSEVMRDCGYNEAQIKRNEIRKKIMANKLIWDYVDDLREYVRMRHVIALDHIVTELAKIAFFDIRTLYDEDGNLKPVCEMDHIAGAAISSIEVEATEIPSKDGTFIINKTTKIKIRDKIAALKELREALGLIPKKTTTFRKDDNGNIIQTEVSGDDLSQLPITFE